MRIECWTIAALTEDALRSCVAITFGSACATPMRDAVSDAIDYAKHRSRSHRAVIRVYNEAGNVIQTHEHTGDFKEP